MQRRTALFNTHMLAQATMGTLAGWDMPLHYGSPVQERTALCEGVGIFDVSHMTIVDLEGPDTPALLTELLVDDHYHIHQPGGAFHSRLLTRDGNMIDDLLVYFLAKHHYRLVFNAAMRDIVCAGLVEHMAHKNITLTLRDDDAMIVLQGPKALTCLSQCLMSSYADVLKILKPFKTLAAQDLFIARTGYTGADGFEIMLPATKAPDFWHRAVTAGAVPCGMSVRDALRLEADSKNERIRGTVS